MIATSAASDSAGIVAEAASATELEARRVMTVCNACRYCEGLCATFKAMTEHREFIQPTLDHLANLCHNCSACLYDCQYAAPHEFDINVPRVLTEARLESYQRYAWPQGLAHVFHNNGVAVALVAGLSLALLLSVGVMLLEPGTLVAQHLGPGAFYEVISHAWMVYVAGTVCGFAAIALMMSGVSYWRTIATQPGSWVALGRALKATFTLENLGGGHGQGCDVQQSTTSNQRRYYHHATMWGFLLCVASTTVATFYDYGLGLVAPYPLLSLPVVLGTLGGLGLLVGPLGLLYLKGKTDADLLTQAQKSMDTGFIASLLLVSVTGLALLALRETTAMGWLLLVHLGFVLGFFLSLPYSKFVHGLYRFLSLMEHHRR